MKTFSQPHSAVATSCLNTVVTGVGTQYVGLMGSVPNSTEAVRASIVPNDGTISKGFVRISTGQSGTGALVCTWRKNGSDQALVVTIAAGSAAGAYSDLTNSFSVAAGDSCSIKLAQGSGNSGAIVGVASYLSGWDSLWSRARTMIGDTGGSANVAGGGSNQYGYFFGSGQSTTEATRQCISPIDATMRNFFVRTAGTNPSDGALVATVRINGADTGMVVTIGAASAAGTFYDVTNSATISAGQTFGIRWVKSGASAGATIQGKSIYIYNDHTQYSHGRSSFMIGTGNGTVGASSTVFTGGTIGGSWSGAELQRASVVGGFTSSGFACVLQKAYLRTGTTQSATGSLVCTLRKNTVNQAITITVAAGSAAGLFSDIANRVSFDSGDRVGWKGVQGSGTSATTNLAIFGSE